MSTGFYKSKRTRDSNHIECETRGCPMYYNSNNKVVTGYCKPCETRRKNNELRSNKES